MPKRIRFSVKIQKINRIKTKTADRNGRQKTLSTRLSVGIWRSTAKPYCARCITCMGSFTMVLRNMSIGETT